MQLDFHLPDCRSAKLTFVRFPLGFEFQKNHPFAIGIVHSGSHAEELGVQCDWVATSCNGKCLTDMSVRDGMRILNDAFMSLPQLPSTAELMPSLRSTLM